MSNYALLKMSSGKSLIISRHIFEPDPPDAGFFYLPEPVGIVESTRVIDDICAEIAQLQRFKSMAAGSDKERTQRAGAFKLFSIRFAPGPAAAFFASGILPAASIEVLIYALSRDHGRQAAVHDHFGEGI